MRATYSPEDNKLRLYTTTRLDDETYKRVAGAGFRWAGAQKFFVAPMWTPAREDLLIDLAGEIADDDITLVDRASERAERFEDYKQSRERDAEQAHKSVASIADNIPFGQPILVGHHSERHARRDAKRIEQGMRRAVQMWDTARYWEQRAAGAIQHAKYKERPDVRARRIKKLESEERKICRDRDKAAAGIKLWEKVHEPDSFKRKDGAPTTFTERALFLANTSSGAGYGIWSALKDQKITPEEAQEQALNGFRRSIEWADRWLNHYANRLTYERAMLAASASLTLAASDFMRSFLRSPLL